MSYSNASTQTALSPLAQDLLREIEDEASAPIPQDDIDATETEINGVPAQPSATNGFVNMLTSLDDDEIICDKISDEEEPDDSEDSEDEDMGFVARPEDAVADAAQEGEIEESPEENMRGFWTRFGRGRAVLRRVGFKNAAAAYQTQSSGSLLPFTIFRIVILVLVAVMPPTVNFLIIQPQIIDNTHKLNEINKFEAGAETDREIANNVAEKVIRAQKIGIKLVEGVLPTRNFEVLFNGYIDALQRYGMVLNSYNVSASPEQTIIFGDKNSDNKKLQANIVTLELEGRYDVYTEIRSVFVAESKRVKLLSERFQPLEKSLNLRITSKILVPTLERESQ